MIHVHGCFLCTGKAIVFLNTKDVPILALLWKTVLHIFTFTAVEISHVSGCCAMPL